VISIERALEVTLAAVEAAPDRMPAEAIPLESSLGRILRENIDADADYPDSTKPYGTDSPFDLMTFPASR
jgi:molybdopterin biosynthesis enzyme